jgi:hypothetical protein
MERERTPYEIMYYAVYLIFEGLSLRACSRAIEPYARRSHIAIWNWMLEVGSKLRSFQSYSGWEGKGVNVSFAIDETGIKEVRRFEAFLFLLHMEPLRRKNFLGLYLAWTASSPAVELILEGRIPSREKTIVILFLDHRRVPIGYPLACSYVNLNHHIHIIIVMMTLAVESN